MQLSATTPAIEPPAPLAGLTPSQRRALARLSAGPAVRAQRGWQGAGGAPIPALTARTLVARGLVRVMPASRLSDSAIALTVAGEALVSGAALQMAEAGA